MTPALAELVRLLAEAAVAEYLADVEAEECDDTDDTEADAA